jgi:DsbC/DsbD-like thiol-disulfide interchange protein
MNRYRRIFPIHVFPVVAALVIGGLSASPVSAEGLTSPWFEGFNNKARLLAGSVDAAGASRVFAGIDILMPPGWKTYWRVPGDAGGIPPEFDWTGSENLAEARVLYPAPHRLTDKSGDTIGYKDHVTFPVALTAKEAAKPILLKLKAAYGVCKDLCVPAEAELQLSVPAAAPASPEIGAVLATVPSTTPVAGRDPAVSAWRVETRDGKPSLTIEVADPGGTGGDAFVDAKGGIYLPLPKKVSDAPGKAVYMVDLTDGVDIKDLKGKPIAVTLVGTKGQSETTITLP